MIEFATYPSPIGLVRVAARGAVVVAMSCGDADDERITAQLDRRFPNDDIVAGADPGGAVTALAEYFGGDVRALERLTVDPGGTPFQASVWAALRTIPAGTTWSYADLARAIGKPSAVRAVGAANGANPIWPAIPCHRVINAGGGLGGYGGGLDRKVWLLRHEGAWSEPEQLALVRG